MPMEEDRESPLYPAAEHLLQKARQTEPLAGPRVTLRPLLREDCDVLAQVQRTDLILRKRLAQTTDLGYRTIPVSGADFAREMRAWCEQQRAISYSVIGPGGSALGQINLFHVDMQECSAEVGYWLASSAWGRGYSSEALGLLLRQAVSLGLRVFRARIPRSHTAYWRAWAGFGASIQSSADLTQFECELLVKNPKYDAALARALRAEKSR